QADAGRRGVGGAVARGREADRGRLVGGRGDGDADAAGGGALAEVVGGLGGERVAAGGDVGPGEGVGRCGRRAEKRGAAAVELHLGRRAVGIGGRGAQGEGGPGGERGAVARCGEAHHRRFVRGGGRGQRQEAAEPEQRDA